MKKNELKTPDLDIDSNYSAVAQEIIEMKSASNEAVRYLSYGYLEVFDEHGNYEGVGYEPDEERIRRDEAVERFLDLRAQLVSVYDDPESTPVLALSARINELYMLSRAYSENVDGLVFDDSDYDRNTEYPQHFSDDISTEGIPDNTDLISRGLEQQDKSFNDLPGELRVQDFIQKYGIQSIIEKDMSIELSELDSDDYAHFLDFVINGSNSQYNDLKTVLESVPQDKKIEFTEAYLALEFGDEFGDIILDLASKSTNDISREKLHGVLSHISLIRKNGAEISKFIASNDESLEQATSIAIIKRTTELLAFAAEEGLEAIMPTLNVLVAATETIKKALNEDSFTIHSVRSTHGSLQAIEQPVTITARPSGRNARIGFTVRGLGDSGKDRISIRLDYEDGGLSLDIGSVASSGVTISDTARMVGETLARGERVIVDLRAQRAAESGQPPQEVVLNGNHVREAFSHFEDLQPEEFSQIVNRFLYSLKLADQSPTQLEIAA